jgi:adenosylmethionine---8-amino-7-oxononanoate aminotransferase
MRDARRSRQRSPAISNLCDVRVQGAIGVVELDHIDDLGALRCRFIEAGVFVRPIRNIVYLTPAFTTGEEDLERLAGAVVSVLEQWTRL